MYNDFIPYSSWERRNKSLWTHRHCMDWFGCGIGKLRGMTGSVLRREMLSACGTSAFSSPLRTCKFWLGDLRDFLAFFSPVIRVVFGQGRHFSASGQTLAAVGKKSAFLSDKKQKGQVNSRLRWLHLWGLVISGIFFGFLQWKKATMAPCPFDHHEILHKENFLLNFSENATWGENWSPRTACSSLSRSSGSIWNKLSMSIRRWPKPHLKLPRHTKNFWRMGDARVDTRVPVCRNFSFSLHAWGFFTENCKVAANWAGLFPVRNRQNRREGLFGSSN